MSKTKINIKPNIKPLFDYVLIKPLETETRTPSGIVIPDTAKEKPQMGEVVAVGPGDQCCNGDCQGSKKSSEMFVKVGDKVLYKKWAGNEVKINTDTGPEEWLLVEQKDIMAIVE
ncbi:MAG: co-chaperone GroES [Patescibacteria group bacterium]|nr:co-chaperone GroES [Patescibacteria group bacterium]